MTILLQTVKVGVVIGVVTMHTMMSLNTTEPYIFNLKNILRQLDDVVDWKALGMELDISSARLNEIEVNNRGRFGACRRDMVEAWLATDGAASWSKLADALVAVGQNVRAELVRGLGRQAGELYLSGCGFGKVWLRLCIWFLFSCKSCDHTPSTQKR